jgi:long-subunit fatty acid transport protein
MKLTRIALLALCASLLPRAARAIEIKVSAQALERTLNRQLFTQNGRYYLRGKPGSACYAYAEDPKVSFQANRVVVHVKVHAKLGTSLHSACLGVSLNTEADVAVVPEAEGESIGFRNAEIARLSESRELNFFLVPFLSGKLPQEMKVNVADSLRQLLSSSTGSTGYQFRLDDLKIHSMQVAGGALAVDFDGNLSVQ